MARTSGSRLGKKGDSGGPSQVGRSRPATAFSPASAEARSWPSNSKPRAISFGRNSETARDPDVWPVAGNPQHSMCAYAHTQTSPDPCRFVASRPCELHANSAGIAVLVGTAAACSVAGALQSLVGGILVPTSFGISSFLAPTPSHTRTHACFPWFHQSSPQKVTFDAGLAYGKSWSTGTPCWRRAAR